MDTQTKPPRLLTRILTKVTAQPVILVFLATFAIVAVLNPVKIGLLIYGISKLTLFSWVGVWLDARHFASARPEGLEGQAQGAAWKRRAWIIIACIGFAALLP